MKVITLLSCYLLLFVTRPVQAVNSVAVESRSFLQGENECEVGVFFSNSEQIMAFVLPLEIRTLTNGAYPASRFSISENPGGRLYASALGRGWSPPPNTTIRYYAVPSGIPCADPAAITYSASAVEIDYESPDGVLYSADAHSTCQPPIGETCWLGPGSDPPGTENASLLIHFDAPTNLGTFEIDTCCIRPANHLTFVLLSTQFSSPEFTKGIITIAPCPCVCAHDPVCDSTTDVLDVASVIDVAFRNATEFSDPACSRSRTDVNSDGWTDVVDVVKTVYVAFFDQSPDTYLVNPCAGGN